MKKLFRIAALSLLLVITAFFIAGCDFGTSESSSSSDQQDSPTQKITVDPDSFSATVDEIAGYYYITITGTATNTSGKNFSYASVSFSVFDSDGAQIGNAIDNISNLPAGTTWKFSAMGVLQSPPATYRLTDITAF